MTYQNLGYWIGQANDGSTGRHPTGWANGQRWSLTSDQWMGMFDSSQSALAAMTADRDAWHTNANAAYDSGTWGVGNLWSADAHNDPNVWTNRYNAGYAAGLPPGATVHMATQAGYGPQGSVGWSSSWQASLTADRAGHWVVVGRASRSSYDSGVQLSVGSTAPGGSLGAFHGLDQGQANTSNGLAGDFWEGFLSAGQVVQAKAWVATQGGGGTLYLDMYFVPTAADPH